MISRVVDRKPEAVWSVPAPEGLLETGQQIISLTDFLARCLAVLLFPFDPTSDSLIKVLSNSDQRSLASVRHVSFPGHSLTCWKYDTPLAFDLGKSTSTDRRANISHGLNVWITE